MMPPSVTTVLDPPNWPEHAWQLPPAADLIGTARTALDHVRAVGDDMERTAAAAWLIGIVGEWATRARIARACLADQLIRMGKARNALEAATRLGYPADGGYQLRDEVPAQYPPVPASEVEAVADNVVALLHVTTGLPAVVDEAGRVRLAAAITQYVAGDTAPGDIAYAAGVDKSHISRTAGKQPGGAPDVRRPAPALLLTASLEDLTRALRIKAAACGPTADVHALWQEAIRAMEALGAAERGSRSSTP